MDSIELLAKQIQGYQDQNQREHELLEKKMDDHHKEVLSIYQVVTSKLASHEKQLEDLKEGQKKILDSGDARDKRIKGLEDHQLKREHSWTTFLKWSGAIATIATITGVVLKLFGVF